MDEMRFDDDVVIITGAGRGLGREYALAFAARGAAVVVNDVGVDADGANGARLVAQDVVDEITAAGGNAIANSDSVVDPAGARAIVNAALEAFGQVTVLVNNAGIIDFAKLEGIEGSAWQRMLDVTMTGAFQMSKAAWPHFARQGHGRIINTTSNAGFAGCEQLVHYGAAKMGVAGFTKALAQEVGKTGITVTAVAPMAITRMNREAFFAGAEQGDDWKADIRNGVAPMGPASAVAPTVLWLAHRSTQANGAIYSTSSGRVSRVAFVVGEGYFNPDHSVEDLRDSAERINSLGLFLEPIDTAAELVTIPRLFGAT